jgi:hypothetical protein
MRRRLFVVLAALGATVVACQLVAGIERVDKAEPPPPEAGPDLSIPDTSIPDPCDHVRPPSRTNKDDAPNDSVPDLLLALRTVTILPPGGKTLGFDLDNSCTCDERPGTRNEGGASCETSRKVVCDADGGVDNQAASTIAVYSGFLDIDKAANINNRIAVGQQTAILVLSEYNGLANDNHVTFGLFTSEGMREPPGCPGSVTDPSGISTPTWCGEDNWTATSTTAQINNGKVVPQSAGSGYVTEYQFVIDEYRGAASIPFGAYKLSLGSPVAAGRLVPLDGNLNPVDTSQPDVVARTKYWRVDDGVLSGRIRASDVLAAFGTVNTPGDAGGAPKPPLCTDKVFFPVLKDQLCGAIDISSSKDFDFVAKARCDAVSVAIGLTAGSVRVTTSMPPADAGNVCYPIADGAAPTAGPPGVDYVCP